MDTQHVTVGSSPWGEECAQVGYTDYAEHAIAECKAFLAQLLRVAAVAGKTDFPAGFTLEVKAHPHDFGPYYEVGVTYDGDVEGSAELAVWFSDHAPEEWDAEARAELGIPEEE
jgi:hypothetical protein